MATAVEFLIGLAIGSGVVAIYFFLRSKRAGADVARYRARLRQALTMFGVSAVLAVIGEVLLRVR
jgi:hypothetical protein